MNGRNYPTVSTDAYRTGWDRIWGSPAVRMVVASSGTVGERDDRGAGYDVALYQRAAEQFHAKLKALRSEGWPDPSTVEIDRNEDGSFQFTAPFRDGRELTMIATPDGDTVTFQDNGITL